MNDIKRKMMEKQQDKAAETEAQLAAPEIPVFGFVAFCHELSKVHFADSAEDLATMVAKSAAAAPGTNWVTYDLIVRDHVHVPPIDPASVQVKPVVLS